MEPTKTLIDNLDMANRAGPDANPRTWPTKAMWREMETAVEAGLLKKCHAYGKCYCYKTTPAGMAFLRQHRGRL